MGRDHKGRAPGHHSSSWYKRHPEVTPPVTNAIVEKSIDNMIHISNRDRANPVIDFFRKIGGGLGVAALGGFVMTTHFYWWGVAIVCVGVLVLAAESLLTSWNLEYKIAASAFCLVAGLWLSSAVIWVRAPLAPALTASDGDYPTGSDVHGIKWESGMSDLSITISNHTTLDYEGLDITFRADVPTRKFVQVTTVPNVQLSLVQKWGNAEITNYRTIAKDKYGNVVKTPPVQYYASSGGFRLQCPDLPPDTNLELFVALVNPRYPPSLAAPRFGDPSTLAGPKKLAKSVYVDARYRVLNHPHHVEYTYAIN